MISYKIPGTYIRYRGLDITKNYYNNILEKTNKLIETITDYFDIYKHQVRWFHFERYCIDELKYKIKAQHLTGDLGEIFAGILILKDTEIIIGYNTNCCPGRQHFTILHEIHHSFYDINPCIKASPMCSFMSKANYSEKELHQEVTADIAASIYAINDEAILNFIYTDFPPTFKECCEEFEVSYSCLKNRLKNFLVFSCEVDFLEANKIINKYFLGDEEDLLSVIEWTYFS